MEDQLVITLTPLMLTLVPVVAAILQVAKRIEALDKIKQWFPFLGIALAMAILKASGMDGAQDLVMTAIIIGLTASGGYDLVKDKTSAASGTLIGQ